MGKHARYYNESDPEWAVTRLAASAEPVAPRRRAPRALIATGLVSTLVFMIGAFALGVLGKPDARTPTPMVQATASSAPSATPLPHTAVASVAPQVTMAAVPLPRREPVPAPPRPISSVAPETAAPPPARRPNRPANQVGPNKKLKKPVAP